MSTETKKQPLTHDEKIANAVTSLHTAITNKAKSEGNSPEYTFGQRIADGVSKAWKKGDIPNADSIKDEALGLAGMKVLTTGSLVSKATKIMTRALYLSKVDKLRNDLKKANKDISDTELDSKLSPLISNLDKEIAGRVPRKTESTSQ